MTVSDYSNWNSKFLIRYWTNLWLQDVFWVTDCNAWLRNTELSLVFNCRNAASRLQPFMTVSSCLLINLRRRDLNHIWLTIATKFGDLQVYRPPNPPVKCILRYLSLVPFLGAFNENVLVQYFSVRSAVYIWVNAMRHLADELRIIQTCRESPWESHWE